MMRSYAELRGGCRREFVLNYFGADYRGPCGRCDNCEAERVAERRGDELPFDVGSRVAHREWGGGVVHGYDDGRVTVLFDEVGYRTLALELVAERDLLAAEEA
jgi:ATP-dependent DNA helicase RecQ